MNKKQQTYQRRYKIRRAAEKKRVKMFEDRIKELEAQIRFDSKVQGWASFEEKYNSGIWNPRENE